MNVKPLLLISSLFLVSACGIDIDVKETSNSDTSTENTQDESGTDNTNNDQGDTTSDENDNDDTTTDLGFLVLQENESGFCGIDGVIEKEHSGFTSMGYANTANELGSEIKWSVKAEQSGSYMTKIHFADGGNTSRPGMFIVNGVESSNLSTTVTSEWTNYIDSEEIALYLNAGYNSITLRATTDGGLPNIDFIQITGTDLNPGNCADSDSNDNDSVDNGDTGTTDPVDNGDTGTTDPVDNGDTGTTDPVDNGDTGTTDPVDNGDTGTTDPVDNGNNNDDIVTSATCLDLINNDQINWRESSLQTDQEIIACLSETLGQPVGFGEKTTGGYNKDGGSKLVVINTSSTKTPEEQLFDAISDSQHNWIVFDKDDFAQEKEISFHRLFCGDPSVLAKLDNATEAECQSPKLWCENHGVAENECLGTFYNKKLNEKSLPIRNRMVDSNTTIDGRGSHAYMLFMGFAIGGDSEGTSTHVSENVIITNMEFRGAGHTEDHNLDPDMIRSTGESHDIWIHQNTFDTTGDSAWDIKVGAYDITLSFNKLINVKRAGLMGSSDSRTINGQIKATMHNNLFVTHDKYYSDKQYDTLRRVPLMRRGQAHMFNNVFYGYRKDILSVRVGGRILFENNMVLNNATEAANNNNKDDIEYFIEKLLRDFREGGLEVRDSNVWFADSNCHLQGEPGILDKSQGSTPEMADSYNSRSQTTLQDKMLTVGQDLADYLFATTGKGGVTPWVSAYADDVNSVISNAPDTCQHESAVAH